MSEIVYIERVHIPAMSTIGYGYGKTESGQEIEIAGDHRPMRYLGEALAGAGQPIPVEVEDWQIVSLKK